MPRKKSQPAPVQPQAPTPPKGNGAQDPSMTDEQRYLNELFQMAQKNDAKLDPSHKVMIEMMADAEQKIHSATQQANRLEKEIYERQLQLKQLNDAINVERGKAKGLADALLSLRQKRQQKPKLAEVPDQAPATE